MELKKDHKYKVDVMRVKCLQNVYLVVTMVKVRNNELRCRVDERRTMRDSAVQGFELVLISGTYKGEVVYYRSV